MSAPLPPGHTRAASPHRTACRLDAELPQLCAQHGQLWPCYDGRPTQPEPSAGQDTGQLRDELLRWVHNYAIPIDGTDDELVATLLAGPLRQLIAERDEARAQVQRVREEIDEEVAHAEAYPAWEISVLVPVEAGDEAWERIFEAVGDAAYEAQGEDRGNWDVFVSSTKRPEQVPVHLLRRALDGL